RVRPLLRAVDAPGPVARTRGGPGGLPGDGGVDSPPLRPAEAVRLPRPRRGGAGGRALLTVARVQCGAGRPAGAVRAARRAPPRGELRVCRCGGGGGVLSRPVQARVPEHAVPLSRAWAPGVPVTAVANGLRHPWPAAAMQQAPCE